MPRRNTGQNNMCINPIKKTLDGEYKNDNWKGKKGEHYTVEAFIKCGTCSQCIAEKANNWVIRNYYENKAHTKKCFITLTYAKDTKFLVKKDLQDFLKRLRKQLEKQNIKIRTFNAGEYGTLKHRPHFHCIIYGWQDEKPIYKGLSKKGYPMFESELIKRIWGKGITVYQEFNENEIPYIALYDTNNEKISYFYKMKRKEVDKYIKKLKKEIHLDEFEKLYINKKEKARTTDERRKKQIEVFNKARERYKDILKIINFKTKDKKKRNRAKMKYEELKSIINQIETLQEEYNKMIDEKSKYLKIKEFNTWSKSLGWEEFFKEYKRNYEYNFTEYVAQCEYATPTSWVKKLANYGFEDARKEMLLRAEELSSKLSEKELASKNRAREEKEHIKTITDEHTKEKDYYELLEL